MKAIKSALIVIALLLLAPLATPAFAQTYYRISTNELTSLMREKGYTTEADADGDLIWTVDGRRSLLIISKDKQSLQFGYSVRTSTPPSLTTINLWNRSKRYSRTFIDEDGDANLKLDLDLTGGVTKARVLDFLLTAQTSLSRWRSEVLER